jgi:hypothetical protein
MGRHIIEVYNLTLTESCWNIRKCDEFLLHIILHPPQEIMISGGISLWFAITIAYQGEIAAIVTPID